MALTFEGTTVIPLFTSSPGYREWEITRDGQDFCIVNEDGEDGDWTLMQWIDTDTMWQEIGCGVDIDPFLKQHRLILGN